MLSDTFTPQSTLTVGAPTLQSQTVSEPIVPNDSELGKDLSDYLESWDSLCETPPPLPPPLPQQQPFVLHDGM